MTRTFIALDISGPQARRVAALGDRLNPMLPSARWVEEGQLHVTLAFLGDLNDQELNEVCCDAEWVAKANQPFQLRLSGLGAFPNLEKPKALWLGISDGQSETQRLHDDLYDAMERHISVRDHRTFLPHVTIARLSRGGKASPHYSSVISGLLDYDAGSTHVDELAVYASELHSDGPEYYRIATCALGG